MSPVEGGPVPSHVAEIENWVIGFCRELNLPVEDATTDFFAVGGTSLTAMRLIASAEELYGEDVLPPDDLYESSSMGGIATVIARNTRFN
jgi:non-heme Fe2+,alpha-ketoglutarate-dependent halogenase